MGKLRIYTDENVDVRIVEGLRRREVDAFSARQRGALGINDEQHFEKARDLKAVIFTHDPHFIEIAEKLVKSGKGHYGLIFAEMHRLGWRFRSKSATDSDLIRPPIPFEIGH